MARFTRIMPLVALAALLTAAPRHAHADDETKEKPKAKPLPLWVIEGEAPTYLFGALRVPDKRVSKLPATIEKAIEASEVFVGETPMDLASQMKVQAACIIPGGKTLADVAGAELYARIKAMLGSTIPEMMYRQFTPLAMMPYVQMGEYMTRVLQGTLPVDMTIRQKFVAAKKDIDSLSSLESQMRLMQQFTLEEQVEMLRATVDRKEKEAKAGKDALDDMIVWYLAGDVASIFKYAYAALTDDEKLNAKFLKLVLNDPNAQLVDTLIAKLKAAPGKTRFVTLDTNRFLGEQGMLALLRKKGYKVRQLKTGDKLPATKGPASATK